MFQIFSKVTDRFSNAIGYAAVREFVGSPHRRGDVVLDLAGYCQIDSFSCGPVAAAMVAKSFNPNLQFEDIYAAVNPNEETGTSTKRLVDALREFNIGVDQRYNLRFEQLCRIVRNGYPIVLTIQNPCSDCLHWVVAFGTNLQRREIFLLTNGLPVLNRKRFRREEFKRLWQPTGFGIICWGK